MPKRMLDVCGTRSRYNRKDCRCEDCTEAQRVYHADRRRQVAYGRWNPWVDAEPARKHLQELQAAGIGRRRLSELTGLDQANIWRIQHGQPKRGKQPPKQIRQATAEAILAVSASLEMLAGTALVDATGSHRRVQALVAVGWSQRRLAVRLGISPANFGTMMRRPRVLASKARAIRDLYEELWDTVPECQSTQERVAVTRARVFAAARGWAPPMAWNEEDIDNPDAEPSLDAAICGIDEVAIERALAGDKTVPLTKEECAEAVRIGTADQLSARDLAGLLGASTRTIVRKRKAVAA
jgi:hypothetical protein